MMLAVEFKFDDEMSTYICKVKAVLIRTGSQSEITGIVGNHLSGKTNEDVNCIMFSKIDLSVIPQNLGHFFPNSDTLAIGKCGLRRLRKKDLKGLAKLKMLILDENRIKSLPDDVFEETPQLQVISMVNNQVEHI